MHVSALDRSFVPGSKFLFWSIVCNNLDTAMNNAKRFLHLKHNFFHIKAELMKIEHASCPLCQSTGLEAFLTAKDHLLSYENFLIVKCKNCGFVLTQGVPSSEEIGKYYQSQDYVSHSDTRKGLMNKIYHLSRTFMLRKKFGMVNRIATGRNLLDIGCGTGYFPAFMKGKGYKVAGVEADPKTREFAQNEFGFPVLSPDEFLKNEPSEGFDVITLWHVLEHLHEFDRYLEKILASLKPGGVIMIALPNCSAFDARHYKEYWAGYDVPRHLWHFTPSTFKMLAKKYGLNILKMKRLPLDPFYNSMLSEKYKGNRFYMISGLIIGKLAYIESLFNIRKSSSVVYIVKKDN